MTTTARSRRPLSRRKRFVFAGIILAVLIGLLELASYIGLELISQYTVAQVWALRHEPKIIEISRSTREVAHPYLGWVLNPEVSKPVQYEGRLYPINDFGLMDVRNPIHQRSPDKVIVAVSGGSVAWQSTVGGNDALIRELQKQPRFQGKEIVLVRLAMNAYKQPQQLLLLTYLLSLGAEFDILINIDGYNEVALHESENGKHGVFAAFPRAWKARNALLTDPKNLELMARLSRNRTRRDQWLDFCNSLPFQRSATVNFVWKARDQLYLDAIQKDLAAAIQTSIFNPGYQVTGPPQKFKDAVEATDYLVGYWQNCVRQMERICRVNGIEFHQVLPPNQRLKDSKPIGPEEAKEALKWTYFAEPAARGYPRLITAGAALNKEGIHFHDLSLLFKDHSELIYIDDCCHYNSQGSTMLATEIAKIVGQAKD